MLYADFHDIENVEAIMDDAFRKLLTKQAGLTQAAQRGEISMMDYDQKLSDFIRADIHHLLTEVRKDAIKRARNGIKSDDRGATSTAIMRRSYKDQIGGNINIANPGKRMSQRRRKWKPGKIKKRDHLPRTATINRYYGPDRAFILRILEMGRDGFMAESGTGKKGPGSKATWGRRGAIVAGGFFHEMKPDMIKAAERLGHDIEVYTKHLMRR